MSTTVPVDPQNNVFGKTAEIVPQWAKLIHKNPSLADLVREFAVDFLEPKGYPAVIVSIQPRSVDIRSAMLPTDSAEEIRVAFNAKHPETIPPIDRATVSAPTRWHFFHLQQAGEV